MAFSQFAELWKLIDLLVRIVEPYGRVDKAGRKKCMGYAEKLKSKQDSLKQCL